MSDWISVETPPDKYRIYNVVIRLEDGSLFSGFGYWTGEEWERIQAASEYQSFEPTFEEYGMKVLFWSSRPEIQKEKQE